MRAAYVCVDGGVPVYGRKGSSIHVQEVVRALTLAGVRVDLFAARIDGPAPDDLAAVSVHQLPRTSHREPAAREGAAIDADRRIARMLEEAGPFDFIYERYSLWSATPMQFAGLRGVAGILEVNAPLVEEQLAFRELVNRDAAESLTRLAFTSATAVMAVSSDIARYVEAIRGGPEGVQVVPNGVNPARFAPGVRASRPMPGVFTVGFLGTLKPWHGLSTVVDSFEILARHDGRVRLLIVGTGPERPSLEAELTSRGIAQYAEFAGAVDPCEVPGLLASMDAAVVAYGADAPTYFSPLKLFEYMAAELPVVATTVGQARDIVQHDVTGLLCEPSPSAMADALARLRLDADLRMRLGRAARARILRDHTWSGVADRVLDVVRSHGAHAVEMAG